MIAGLWRFARAPVGGSLGRADGPALCIALAAGLLGLAAFTDALAVAGFAIGWPLGAGVFPLAVLLASILFLGLATTTGIAFGRALRILAWIAGGLALATLAAAWVVDTSWDGQKYHLPAIIRLSKGWNPLHEPLPATAESAIPIAHYPMASWLYAAALAVATGSIEAGKSLNLVLMLAAGLLIAAAVARMPGPLTRGRLGVALIAVLNPVAGKQLFTYYVDGALASLILAMVAALLLSRRDDGVAVRVALGLAIVLLINVKFTGAVLAPGIAAGYLAWQGWRGRRWRRPAMAVGLAVLLGVGAIGYHPLVRNWLGTGLPFYPFDGSGAAMAAQRPANLAEAGRAEKLFYGLFAASAYRQGAPARLKPPIVVTPGELAATAAVDTRLGGFGPLFGLAAILTLIVAVHAIARRGWRDPDAAILAALLLATVVAFPEPWWARFVPQLWLVAPLLLLAANPATGRWMWSDRGLIAVLALNIGLSWGAGTGLVGLRAYRAESGLARIADLDKPVTVRAFYRETTRARLSARGIDFRLVERLACPTPILIAPLKTEVCPP